MPLETFIVRDQSILYQLPFINNTCVYFYYNSPPPALGCFIFPKVQFSYDFDYNPSLSVVKDTYAKFQENWMIFRGRTF